MGSKSATAAKAKAKGPDRRELCKELLALRIKHADVFARIDELKADLIKVAADAGEGFREVVTGKGQITVSAPHGAEFKGHVPEVDPRIFDALSEVKRKKLIDAGIIKVVAHYSRDFHGRVDLKVFQGT